MLRGEGGIYVEREALVNARALRQTMTPTERVLWKALRNQQINGLKFRRQHPIGPYIVDYCCLHPQIVIELDGPIHDSQVEYDADRDEYLRTLGFRVLRFRNDEVLADLGVILERIWQQALIPNPSPCGRGEKTA